MSKIKPKNIFWLYCSHCDLKTPEPGLLIDKPQCPQCLEQLSYITLSKKNSKKEYIINYNMIKRDGMKKYVEFIKNKILNVL